MIEQKSMVTLEINVQLSHRTHEFKGETPKRKLIETDLLQRTFKNHFNFGLKTEICYEKKKVFALKKKKKNESRDKYVAQLASCHWAAHSPTESLAWSPRCPVLPPSSLQMQTLGSRSSWLMPQGPSHLLGKPTGSFQCPAACWPSPVLGKPVVRESVRGEISLLLLCLCLSNKWKINKQESLETLQYNLNKLGNHIHLSAVKCYRS